MGACQFGPTLQLQFHVAKLDASFIWYKNVSRSFFGFVTVDTFEKRTDERFIRRPPLHSGRAVKIWGCTFAQFVTLAKNVTVQRRFTG